MHSSPHLRNVLAAFLVATAAARASACTGGGGGPGGDDGGSDAVADGAACPATAPERGATCTGTPHCSYAGSCGGQPSANAVMATCGADGHWQIAEADCFPAMQCPSAPPHDGDRCFPALHCTYGDCSSGASVVEATCPEGGTFSVTTSHCDAAGPDASVSDGG